MMASQRPLDRLIAGRHLEYPSLVVSCVYPLLAQIYHPYSVIMSAEQQQTTSTNAEEVVGSSAPSTHQPAASGLQENAEGDDPKVSHLRGSATSDQGSDLIDDHFAFDTITGLFRQLELQHYRGRLEQVCPRGRLPKVRMTYRLDMGSPS